MGKLSQGVHTRQAQCAALDHEQMVPQPWFLAVQAFTAREDGVCAVTKVKAGYTPGGGGRLFTLRLPEGLCFEENGAPTLSFDPDSLQHNRPLRVRYNGTIQQHA